jgi:hypothetical protein
MTTTDQAREYAMQATAGVQPMIERLRRLDLLEGRNDLHQLWTLADLPAINPEGHWTELYRTNYNDGEQFRPHADRKAVISARTGLPSKEAQVMRPWLLVTEVERLVLDELGIDVDTIYWGSVVEQVVIDGRLRTLIVANSGFRPWFDAAIGEAMKAIFLAQIEGNVEARRPAREEVHTQFRDPVR